MPTKLDEETVALIAALESKESGEQTAVPALPDRDVVDDEADNFLNLARESTEKKILADINSSCEREDSLDRSVQPVPFKWVNNHFESLLVSIAFPLIPSQLCRNLESISQ